MKVSDLVFMGLQQKGCRREITIQTNTDALRILRSNRHVEMYIEEFGDVEVEFHGGIYCVPAFEAERKAYCEAKQAYCNQWGCE